MGDSTTRFSISEVQRNSLISHFTAAAADSAGPKKTPSTTELKQLRDELKRISARAAARAALLEKSQAQCNDRAASLAAEKQRIKDARPAGDHEPGTAATPGQSRPVSKRIKTSQPSTRVAESDSESSTKASSIRGGNGTSIVPASRSGSHGAAGSTSTNASGSNRASSDRSLSQQVSSTPPPAAATPKAKHSVGTPVQDDFSRVKVPNQVQIQTFWGSLEPYFRNITDEDISFLEGAAEDQETYVTPKLGRFYANAWAEEEVAHFPDHLHNSKTRYAAKSLLGSDTHKKPHPDLNGSMAGPDMSPNMTRLAPLTDRIVSALVAERLILNGDGRVKLEDGTSGYRSDSEGSDTEVEPRVLSSSGETLSLEDRLKRELRYIGILDGDDVNWDDREDDEVCVTIRALQRQLREQTRVNSRRKERLLPIAKEHIGFQEYTQVIDELDKQVEQCYIKRHRQTKSRKRKSVPVKTVSLSDNALNAMDRRRRVMQAIGHLFPADKFALPSDSVFGAIPPNPEIQMK
ncbi:Transcriptional regulator [Coemansia sp. RSA 552]|nr:Transcriptional regulator [Coemansia sp. RSA 552]